MTVLSATEIPRPAPTPAPGPTADGALAPPSSARLVAVELRKMVDTRAGRALLVIIEIIAALVVGAAVAFGDGELRTFEGLFTLTLVPLGVLLPVLGILSVTSEWSQRSALTTFTLVPARRRVLAAKAVAATLLALGSLLASLATAAAGTAVGGLTGDAEWTMSWGHLGGAALFQVINVGMGVAFGALLLSSATAIVAFFLVPTLWTALAEAVSSLREPARWLDLNTTLEPLLTGAALSGDDWARLATSTALWLGVPAVLGTLRVLRRDIS